MRHITDYLPISKPLENQRVIAFVCALIAVLLAGPEVSLAQYTALGTVTAPTLSNRLEIGGMYSNLTNQSYANGNGSLRWTREIGNEWAMFGESTFENHFEASDTRLTVGAIRKFKSTNILWGSYTKSPNSDLVATREFNVGTSFFLSAQVPSLMLRYQNRRFTEHVTLQLFTSTTTFSLIPRLAASATHVLVAMPGELSNSGLLNMTFIPTSFLALTFGGGFGSEHYATRTSLGAERGADMVTLDAAATLTLSSTTGVTFTYVHLNRIDQYNTTEILTSFHLEF